MGATEANDLLLYIENDANLHRSQYMPIVKNLATKKVKSQYKHDLAVKAFGYLVESGAKKYAKEFGSPGQPWHKMFDVSTRKLVAEDLTKGFEAEFELGNYDDLLPKKYKKEFAKQHLVPPRHHAQKRVAQSGMWHIPSHLRIEWSPVTQAWMVLLPRPISGEQAWVAIGDTDETHRWLHSTYGAPFGRVGHARTHSTTSSSYASKKSPAQLQREIDAVLGQRRSR